jgi:ribosome-binding protein aMBF1 (putative translation factor)
MARKSKVTKATETKVTRKPTAKRPGAAKPDVTKAIAAMRAPRAPKDRTVEAIASVRKAKGWSVRELANALTYSYWPVRCWENPKHAAVPTVEVLAQIEALAAAK